MEITSEVIKKLRDKTGAGMMDCKRALEASNGDMEAAIDFLRKKGAATGAKRAERAAKEGVIATRVSADGKTGVAVEVNCETDFVGRSDDFTAFANSVVETILRDRPATVEALVPLKSPAGKSIAELQNDLIAQIGEKIEVRRFVRLELQSPAGRIHTYRHMNGKVGVLLEALQWAFQGEEIDPALLPRFAEHARLVLATNREVNLTAIVDPREIAAKHYLDSWRVTRLMPLYGKRLFDLGSGAGFPGVPVAIAEPEAKVTLCDSVQKRATFLERCVKDLALPNAKAVCERAEDHLARNKVDVVLVRAVSSVRENVRTLRKVRHSLKDLVMLKGPSWSREVRAAEREAERLGFKLDTVWEHELPGEMGKRAILVYRAPGSQGG